MVMIEFIVRIFLKGHAKNIDQH